MRGGATGGPQTRVPCSCSAPTIAKKAAAVVRRMTSPLTYVRTSPEGTSPPGSVLRTQEVREPSSRRPANASRNDAREVMPSLGKIRYRWVLTVREDK